MNETEKVVYAEAKIEEFRGMGLLHCIHDLNYEVTELAKSAEASRDRIHLVLTCKDCNRRIGFLENIEKDALY